MDQNHVDELLAPYVRGELDASTEQQVVEHLAACEGCSREERGVRALVEDEPATMTDIERAQLHRRVRSELDITPAAKEAARLTWLPGALTAAALLLAGVVGLQVLEGAGGGDEADSGASIGAPSEAGSGPQPVTLSLDKDGFQRVANSGSGGYSKPEPQHAEDEAPAAAGEAPASQEGLSDEGSEDATIGEGADASAVTKVRSGGDLEAAFARYGRSGEAFVEFARAYEAEDVEPLRDAFIARLAAEAPEEAKAQVAQCADFILASRPYPTLPAAAAHGRYKKQDSLLLGFVWTRETAGPLDNYMLFVWPRGTCETPSHSQIGRIRVGKG